MSEQAFRLPSPSHAVVGSGDLDRQTRFLGTFGFRLEQESALPAAAAEALYGVRGATRERLLTVPDSDRGWVRLVETPHAARAPGPYDHRPLALDLYTRDIAESLELAARAGAHCRPLVEYSVGPLGIKEAETVGPDGLTLVFLEVDPRRPSLLDRVPDRLHSEVHSIVWTVGDAGAALPTWTAEAGLSVLVDAPIGGPTISDLLGLPRPNVPVRFVLLCDEDQNPARSSFSSSPKTRASHSPPSPGGGPPRSRIHGSGSRRRHARHALGGLRRGRHGRHRGPPPSQRRLRRRPGWGAVRAMAGLS